MNFGVPISEYRYINAGVNYESTEIKTNPIFLDPIIFFFLLREGNKYDIFRFTSSFSYDTRNASIFPDRGVLQRIRAQVALPIGDLSYFKVDYDARVFIPLIQDYTLQLKGRIGYGDAYGSTTELPFFENFYAGGPRTVRGYEENSLGPEDHIRSGARRQHFLNRQRRDDHSCAVPRRVQVRSPFRIRGCRERLRFR